MSEQKDGGSADDLKPCPFCGGEAMADYAEPVWKDEIHWYVFCTSCYAKIEIFNDKESYRKAIAAWNRREADICR